MQIFGYGYFRICDYFSYNIPCLNRPLSLSYKFYSFYCLQVLLLISLILQVLLLIILILQVLFLKYASYNAL